MSAIGSSAAPCCIMTHCCFMIHEAFEVEVRQPVNTRLVWWKRKEWMQSRYFSRHTPFGGWKLIEKVGYSADVVLAMHLLESGERQV